MRRCDKDEERDTYRLSGKDMKMWKLKTTQLKYRFKIP